MITIIATYMQIMSCYETNIHVANLRTDYTQDYLKVLEIPLLNKNNDTKENLYAPMSSRRLRYLLPSNCRIIQDTKNHHPFCRVEART